MSQSGQADSRAARRPQVAVCSWSLRPEAVPGAESSPSGSPEELVAALSRVGLTAVQLALVPIVEQPERWGNAIPTLRAAGVEIVSGMLATVGEDYSTLESIAATGGVRPDSTWPATLRRAGRVAELAGREQIRLVTFHAGFIPHRGEEPGREILLERLQTLADLFEHHGVRIAFETGQEGADTLLDALEDLRRPEVGVNFDPANMILYGMGDPVEALRILHRRVHQIHIKDAVPAPTRGQWGREVVAGTGAVDWRAFLAVARAIEPAVGLVIEREAGASRDEDVRAAAALVQRLW